MSKIAKLAELRLDIQGVVLFPAVNVRQDIRMSRS